MKSEKRKKARKSLRHQVWLHYGKDQSASGTISDVSDSGARLDLDKPDGIPDRFILLLSKNGQARRLCRVVWRAEHQIGVQFEPATGSRHAPASAQSGTL
jgi:hypothetical protein